MCACPTFGEGNEHKAGVHAATSTKIPKYAFSPKSLLYLVASEGSSGSFRKAGKELACCGCVTPGLLADGITKTVADGAGTLRHLCKIVFCAKLLGAR